MNFADLLFERARAHPDGAAYYRRVDGAWQATEWREYADRVRRAARALRAVGVAPGERVALACRCCPEWAVLHLAAMSLGAVSVALHSTQPAAELAAQLRATRAVLALVDERAPDAGPELRHIVALSPPDDPGESDDDDDIIPWSSFLARGEGLADAEADAEADADADADAESAHPAVIAYTPGTAGPSKGVLLSHANLRAAADALIAALDLGERDWSLAYLPLAHPLELALTVHIPTLIGSLVYYAESPAEVARDLRTVQPSVFLAAPRVWRSMHDTVATSLDRLRGWQRALVTWARRVASRVQTARRAHRRPWLGTRVADAVARYLVIGKLQRALGLSNARACLSTGDALPPDTREFFASLGVGIDELYGQVETGGFICVIGTGERAGAGDARPELRIDARDPNTPVGEVLVRGPGVCLGYLSGAEAPEAPEAPEAGWHRTGDLGAVDEHGHLQLLGRREDVLPGPDGVPLAAGEWEHRLIAEPSIADAVVVLDAGGELRALCVLPAEAEAEAANAALARLTRERGHLPAIVGPIVVQPPWTVEAGTCTPMFTVNRARLRAELRASGETAE